MKANNGSGNNPNRDEWETPQELFDKLDKQYHFDIDCCANRYNTKTEKFACDFENEFVIFPLNYICWMNPPFSKAEDMFKIFFKLRKGVAIYRCDNMETHLWQDIIFRKADWICIPIGRVCYEGMSGSGSRFPSALIGIGVDPPNYIEGTLLKVIN